VPAPKKGTHQRIDGGKIGKNSRLLYHQVKGAEDRIHDDDTGRADQEGSAASETIGQRSVDHHRQTVDQRHQRLEQAQVTLGPAENFLQRGGQGREIVARHVEKRVHQADKNPVLRPTLAVIPLAKLRRYFVLVCHGQTSQMQSSRR